MKRIAGLALDALFVLLLATGLIGAATWANCRWGTGPDTLPGWIEALSTFAAFIAAVIAVRYTKRVFEIEQKRDERLDEDRRSAQASTVAAWVGIKTIHIEKERDSWRPARDVEQYGYFLRNASELPVTNLEFRTGKMLESFESLDVLPPGDEPLFIRLDQNVVNDFTNDGVESPPVTLSFTDAAGHRWIRDGATPLRRLES